MSWPDYQRLYDRFGFNNMTYMLPAGSIAKMTALEGQRNPIVAACVRVRMSVFAEAEFTLLSTDGKKKKSTNATLNLLRRPWAKGTTQALLTIMETDNCFYGNSYWIVRNGELVRLDPTYVRVLTADVLDESTSGVIGKRTIGYSYVDKSGQTTAIFQPSEVVHYMPNPDPEHPERGASWLQAILPDVSADIDMTTYKTSFLHNAATPQVAVIFKDGANIDSAKAFKQKFEDFHTGPDNAFKTLYVGAGADIKVLGANFEQMSFAAVQGQGETRIAAAAGVPASLLGIAEGLKGSTLNEGNFSATRRLFADTTLRWLWRSVCGALETVVRVPNGNKLWYTENDIPFLQADEADAAEIRQFDATTAMTLVNAGYDPESVIACIRDGSWEGLAHTGLISVQLQPVSEMSKPAPTNPETGG